MRCTPLCVPNDVPLTRERLYAVYRLRGTLAEPLSGWSGLLDVPLCATVCPEPGHAPTSNKEVQTDDRCRGSASYDRSPRKGTGA